eukprot:Rhum_TRINITY_DN7820_c0_g1::Rhum_TRINITY_DN7820_c0_g1_i1::g.24822::m.24822
MSGDVVALGAAALVGGLCGGGLSRCLASRNADSACGASSSAAATTSTSSSAAKQPAALPPADAAATAPPAAAAAATASPNTARAVKTTTVTPAAGGSAVTVAWVQGEDAAAVAAVRAAAGATPEQLLGLRKGQRAVAMTFAAVEEGDCLAVDVLEEGWRAASDRLRKQGNARFLAGNQTGSLKEFAEALKMYRKAYEAAPADGGEEAVAFTCLAKNNCAQICLKWDRFTDCRAVCADILSKDPSNIKALYRRGVAAKKLGPNNLAMLNESATDLEKAVLLAPGQSLEADVRRELQEVKELIAKLQPTQLSTAELD